MDDQADRRHDADTVEQQGFANPEATIADTTEGGSRIRPLSMPDLNNDPQAKVEGGTTIFSDHLELEDQTRDQELDKEAQATILGRIQSGG